jgi:two-component system response regulator HydG
VLIMTAFSSVDTAVEAIKSGALDYLVKPLDFDTLQQTLVQALAHTVRARATPALRRITVGHDWRQPGDAGAS